MISTVIFELDGVLLDSRKYDFVALAHALQDIHITLEKSHYVRLAGLPEPVFNRELHKSLFILMPDSVKTKRKALLKGLIKQASAPMPGLNSLLARLRKDSIKVAVVSSEDEEYMRYVLSAIGLEKGFDLMLSANKGDIRNLTNGDSMLRIAAAELGSQPEECLVVVDSMYGAENAKKAGMRCIAVPNDFTRNHDFSDADAIVGSLENIDAGLIGGM